MSIGKLPPELLHDILVQSAYYGNSTDFRNLTRTCSALFRAYKGSESLLLRVLLQTQTGPDSYELALELARLEHGRDHEALADADDTPAPSSQPPASEPAILRLATATHPSIHRFARFCFSYISLTESPPLALKSHPHTLSLWIPALYTYLLRWHLSPHLPSRELISAKSLHQSPIPAIDAYTQLLHRIWLMALYHMRRFLSSRMAVRNHSAAEARAALRAFTLEWQTREKWREWRWMGAVLGVWEEGYLERWEVGEGVEWEGEEWKVLERATNVLWTAAGFPGGRERKRLYGEWLDRNGYD